MTKVKISIDGKTYEVEQGMNLVDAAATCGIFIPSLCYYKHIDPPLATCRVCTVKINGKPRASCLIKVEEGMQIEFDTPELKNNRKAVIELMFAEGNHFCPGCEKGGDCDLQHLGYRAGIRSLRFPHLFVDRVIDFNPKRMVIEHNRCIKCKRCVEEVFTEDGKQVFSYSNRGNKTVVSVDYEQEAKLTHEQAVQAMHLCPTGAILVKGRSETRPVGHRKYDDYEIKPEIPEAPLPAEPPVSNGNSKAVVATTSLAGCFGCHMSMLDIDLGILDLIEVVEFNKSPLTDIKIFTKRADIGLIEGGCCNTENVEVLRLFRKMCDILVSVGECAIWGGVPALRNTIPLDECLEEAYLNSMTSENDEQIIPAHEDIPKILDNVYACDELVKIDYHIPGCPPSPEHIWKVVTGMLKNKEYSILYPEFKYD